LLFEIYGEKVFTDKELNPLKDIPESELKILKQMLVGKLNSPLTSSMGRLFDGIASITGISKYSHFEGQAAMELEFAAESVNTSETYPFKISENNINYSDVKFFVDWEPIILNIIEDLKKQISKNVISAKFHNTLANVILEIAKRTGEKRVVLSGGCFQNKYLIEKTIQLLEENNFKPYWHQRVPTNDGGISLGQIMIASNNFIKGV